ncbi:MAG: VOC family protein [Bacteroidales bacterium]|jgi:methylmalonyl-CoA/ethylmalonyl-CoA epimerase|nr:VOC family protein [Bacteroidales bacterium]
MIKNLKFHHIGYAVNDINATASFYTNAGWTLSQIYNDKIQNAKIAFLKREGFPLVELVAAVDEKSPVVNILKKNGVSPYHICYEVEVMDEAIWQMKQQHFIPLFKPVEAVALQNRKICYLYNKEVGLIEFLEKK